ncbi:FERRY endosomal RAB5 effector complex subunit 3 [Anticarsia gemmatalis]|uniref:FERRY endosomal RAB5 effector complex subunit 3 n=1 Tax=Anticarsia gemmatalis TaxID=129554 RepID=UPI003F765EBB
MAAETAPKSIVKTFWYNFPACNTDELTFKLEVPVDIPLAGSTRELVQRVIYMFRLPVYVEEELTEKLEKFVAHETMLFHNSRDGKLIDKLKNNEVNVEGIIKNWEKSFKDNVMEFAEQKGTSDEEVFAAAYHKLVHSPALDTILQVENSYAKTVRDTLENREEDIKKLTQQQTEEMENKIKQLNISTTEEDINELAAAHFEQQALVAGRWGSQLDALRQTQRAQHRSWLMSTLEEYQSTSALNTPSNSPLATFSEAGALPPPSAAPPAAAGTRLEESFTIHLGSQLKQTHNIRIVAMDLMELCAVPIIDNPAETSRRLQTALSLYSSELAGLVLLTESPPRRPAPPTTSLVAAATASTEHHFADVELQLKDISEKVHDPVAKRNTERLKEKSEAQGEGAQSQPSCLSRRRQLRDLQPGDMFMTKHSNLADMHIVFHLIVDDSELRSSDITSRHPTILGLRNILKAACSNDVTNLAIPLLLRHEMSEEMTVAWCVRRAELVLKCAKGFMLEAAGAGGAELRTLHFVLPPNTAPQLFATLANLLPAIFRVSNPVKSHKPE